MVQRPAGNTQGDAPTPRTGAAGGRPLPARVLVVDDDAAFRWLVAAALGDAGYAVLEAPDGPAALAPLAAAAVAPGASLDVTVLFDPKGAGDAHGTLSVQSNAPGSPHAVTLRGRGRKVGSPL
jgi:hypothetical protein